MGEYIKLSKYADNLTKEYQKEHSLNCKRIIEYLNRCISEDLYTLGKSKNPTEVYKRVIGWLFKFYPNKLQKSFADNGFDYNDLKKNMIFCFIITFFRDKEKAHRLYDSLKDNNIVFKIISYDDEKYELYTIDYGIITFYNINSFVNSNPALLDKCKQMGSNILYGCHEISEFLIKNDDSLVALTGILTSPLDQKIFHSIVLDGTMIIDIPNGIIMSQDDYFILNDFQVISKCSYNELKLDDEQLKKYDESKTLYSLLRRMLFKLYKNDIKNDNNKSSKKL